MVPGFSLRKLHGMSENRCEREQAGTRVAHPPARHELETKSALAAMMYMASTAHAGFALR